MSDLYATSQKFMAAMIRVNRAWNLDMPQEVKDRRLGEMAEALDALMRELPIRLPGNGFTLWTVHTLA